MSAIESVLNETRAFPPAAEFVKTANISGMAAYRAMCAEAETDFEGFWAKHARAELKWSKPFTKTLDESNAPFFKWFHDGELNVSENCLDRHLPKLADKVAIIFEADDGKVTRVTYKELYHRVCHASPPWRRSTSPSVKGLASPPKRSGCRSQDCHASIDSGAPGQ